MYLIADPRIPQQKWTKKFGDLVCQTGIFKIQKSSRIEPQQGRCIGAGNDGNTSPHAIAGSCIYEDNMKELCVLVAALGTDGKIASYSNKCGIASNYCITAPGTSIQAPWYTSSTSYATISGTSMAAPMVSGGLALIKQKHSSLSVTRWFHFGWF